MAASIQALTAEMMKPMKRKARRMQHIITSCAINTAHICNQRQLDVAIFCHFSDLKSLQNTHFLLKEPI